MKNILLLHSSPRKNGNSNALAESFIAGAQAAGHKVQRINIGQADIHPCIACEYCRTHNQQCRFNDAMQEIAAAVLTADCVVMAAPLYFYGLPAQLKAAIDRFYVFGPQYPIRGKETALLMTAADTTLSSFDGAVKNYELALIDYLKWQDRGRILVPGVYDSEDIKNNPALDKAYQLGLAI